jgi:4-hydroxybenzoate polyprenyltransferase
VRTFLRLVRAPNLPSAVADVVAGGALAGAALGSGPLILAAVGSAALYAGGVALNDAFDVEKDRRLHPERVLPSGRMSVGAARALGFLLLAAGVASGLPMGVPGLVVAAALAAAIVAYDLLPESAGIAGPLVIGLCRGLNLLRGATDADGVASTVLGFAALHFGLVACIGVLSLAEDRASPGRFAGGALVALPFFYAGPTIAAFSREESLLALGVLVASAELALWVVRPARRAGGSPASAVPRAVFSLTILGALTCAAVRAPAAAGVLVGLFGASRLLARWLGQRGS